MIWWALDVEVEFKKEEEEEQIVLSVLEVEVEFKEENEEEQVIWWVLEAEVRFEEEEEEEQDLVDVGGRIGVQGGRTGRFECFGGRGGVKEKEE